MQSSQFLPVIESLATGTPGNLVQQTDAAKFLANLKGLERINIVSKKSTNIPGLTLGI